MPNINNLGGVFMGHEHHGHDHNHVHTNNKKILLISFIIIAVFMIVEVIGGYITNSLAYYQMPTYAKRRHFTLYCINGL